MSSTTPSTRPLMVWVGCCCYRGAGSLVVNSASSSPSLMEEGNTSRQTFRRQATCHGGLTSVRGAGVSLKLSRGRDRNSDTFSPYDLHGSVWDMELSAVSRTETVQKIPSFSNNGSILRLINFYVTAELVTTNSKTNVSLLCDFNNGKLVICFQTEKKKYLKLGLFKIRFCKNTV